MGAEWLPGWASEAAEGWCAARGLRLPRTEAVAAYAIARDLWDEMTEYEPDDREDRLWEGDDDG